MISHPIRVLLVDDDEDDYLITRELLYEIDKSMYELEWVNTFDAGDQVITKCEHDIYLIDYRLGERTGLQLLKNAIERDCRAPIILLTGLDDREVDIEAMKSGAYDYLVKGQIEAPLLERSIRYALERKRVLDQLRESEKRKEIFFATLTHDLKTPLRAERRILDLLLEGQFGSLTDEQREIMQEVLKSNQFMYRMVDNLLSAFKYEYQQLIPKKELVDLNQLISTIAFGEFMYLTNEKNQTMKLELAETLPQINLDPMEIKRVLHNLIQNAITFTPNEGVITVHTELDGDKAWVRVQDTGAGIEPEKMDKLFQPFSSMSKKFRQIGTGLGLYLTKQIVEAHDGQILVKSEPGRGSEFYFSLPVHGRSSTDHGRMTDNKAV